MSIGDWNEQSLQAFIRRYLDQLGLTGAFVNRANSALLKLAKALVGDHSISFGQGTFTWGGATAFTTQAVAHGLPSAPTVALCTAAVPAGSTLVVTGVNLIDGTNVTWQGRTVDGTVPAAASTRTFYWLAIS